jgi:hypothetical protein
MSWVRLAICKLAVRFDILSKYEKASGSRINYNKTKAISIGNARYRKPKFNKISWIKENVKTLGVHHGNPLYIIISSNCTCHGFGLQYVN